MRQPPHRLYAALGAEAATQTAVPQTRTLRTLRIGGATKHLLFLQKCHSLNVDYI